MWYSVRNRLTKSRPARVSIRENILEIDIKGLAVLNGTGFSIVDGDNVYNGVIQYPDGDTGTGTDSNSPDGDNPNTGDNSNPDPEEGDTDPNPEEGGDNPNPDPNPEEGNTDPNPDPNPEEDDSYILGLLASDPLSLIRASIDDRWSSITGQLMLLEPVFTQEIADKLSLRVYEDSTRVKEIELGEYNKRVYGEYTGAVDYRIPDHIEYVPQLYIEFYYGTQLICEGLIDYSDNRIASQPFQVDTNTVSELLDNTDNALYTEPYYTSIRLVGEDYGVFDPEKVGVSYCDENSCYSSLGGSVNIEILDVMDGSGLVAKQINVYLQAELSEQVTVYAYYNNVLIGDVRISRPMPEITDDSYILGLLHPTSTPINGFPITCRDNGTAGALNVHLNEVVGTEEMARKLSVNIYADDTRVVSYPTTMSYHEATNGGASLWVQVEFDETFEYRPEVYAEIYYGTQLIDQGIVTVRDHRVSQQQFQLLDVGNRVGLVSNLDRPDLTESHYLPVVFIGDRFWEFEESKVSVTAFLPSTTKNQHELNIEFVDVVINEDNPPTTWTGFRTARQAKVYLPEYDVDTSLDIRYNGVRLGILRPDLTPTANYHTTDMVGHGDIWAGGVSVSLEITGDINNFCPSKLLFKEHNGFTYSSSSGGYTDIYAEYFKIELSLDNTPQNENGIWDVYYNGIKIGEHSVWFHDDMGMDGM